MKGQYEQLNLFAMNSDQFYQGTPFRFKDLGPFRWEKTGMSEGKPTGCIVRENMPGLVSYYCGIDEEVPGGVRVAYFLFDKKVTKLIFFRQLTTV